MTADIEKAVMADDGRRLQIPVAPVFLPLLAPSRYKGAFGGRGSGKSWFMAGLQIRYALQKPGLRAVCIREVQKSLKESAKRLIEDTIEAYQVGSKFNVLSDRIETPGGGVIVFQGMQDHTAESVKSLEGFDVAWVEEAQSLSSRSLQLLRPTIRAEGSELWFSWNPRKKTDPVDTMFRAGALPTNATMVQANWNDNPWFPSVLDDERRDTLANDPDQYAHIWDGDYITVAAGAYFAQHLAAARTEGRIGFVPRDPLMTVRLFFDIGGTGAKADACSIWATQFIGSEIRLLHYYESVGQPLDTHVAWLNSKGYGPNRAQIWLPHDGRQMDKVFSVSYESALKEVGYKVTVIPNQGRGAAMSRVQAARRLFPAMRFNEKDCKGGLEALGWYHEKIDENRGIGLGPEHDWASHAADSFGLMAVAYKQPQTSNKRPVTFKVHRPRDRAMGY